MSAGQKSQIGWERWGEKVVVERFEKSCFSLCCVGAWFELARASIACADESSTSGVFLRAQGCGKIAQKQMGCNFISAEITGKERQGGRGRLIPACAGCQRYCVSIEWRLGCFCYLSSGSVDCRLYPLAALQLISCRFFELRPVLCLHSSGSVGARILPWKRCGSSLRAQGKQNILVVETCCITVQPCVCREASIIHAVGLFAMVRPACAFAVLCVFGSLC